MSVPTAFLCVLIMMFSTMFLILAAYSFLESRKTPETREKERKRQEERAETARLIYQRENEEIQLGIREPRKAIQSGGWGLMP